VVGKLVAKTAINVDAPFVFVLLLTSMLLRFLFLRFLVILSGNDGRGIDELDRGGGGDGDGVTDDDLLLLSSSLSRNELVMSMCFRSLWLSLSLSLKGPV